MLRNKKYFNQVIIIVIAVAILFSLGIVVLKYSVEGETNMPFRLSKIAVISSSEGLDKESSDAKWAFDIFQSNDIFLYIDKNDGYGKTEAIKTIEISNIQIEAKNKDKIKIYRPDEQGEKQIFKNKKENIVENIEYSGSMESDFKQLKISNQGGLVAFRISIDNLASYQSNEEEINHHELLKKVGITQEELAMKVSFTLTIKLEEGRGYQTNISLDLPAQNVIEQGTASREITDVKDFIFRRM